MLAAEGRQESAYQIFEELFAEDVRFYQPLIQINRQLGRDNRNAEILDKAIGEYRYQVGEKQLSVEEWVAAWTNIFNCLKETRDYAAAERMLKKELQLQATSEDGPAKQKFVEQMLSSIYLLWATSLPTEAGSQRLQLLKLAYENNPISPSVLTELTKDVLGSDAVLAEAARQVYDPARDLDAPSTVLNALGSDALSKGEHEAAIRYYELARRGLPRIRRF